MKDWNRTHKKIVSLIYEDEKKNEQQIFHLIVELAKSYSINLKVRHSYLSKEKMIIQFILNEKGFNETINPMWNYYRPK